MKSADNVRPVLVAIDGSESALRAAHWAAAQATRRGRGLSMVHTYDWPLPHYRPGVVDPAVLHDSVISSARATLAAAVTAVTEAAPALSVTAEIVAGSAVTALLPLTRRADLLVLGSRGLVGSVAVELVADGHCPVVVVRGDQPAPGTPVVVGAWNDSVVPFGLGSRAQPVDWTPMMEQAETLLTESLAGWAEKYPGVTVRRVVVRDRLAAALLDAARDAQLLVVGSRGRGGFTGLTRGPEVTSRRAESPRERATRHGTVPVRRLHPVKDGDAGPV